MNAKIGMNLFLWLTHFGEEHFHLLPTLKAVGFDGVEIPISNYSDKELRAIRNALDSEGLACTSVSLLTTECNPIAEDASIRRSAVDKVRSDIEIAAGLGAEVIAGPLHSAHKQFFGRGPNEQEFERCVEFLKTVGADAQQANVQISVEPLNRFECYFLNTQQQGKALADAVDMDSVGILYDTHHVHLEEHDVAAALKGLGKRINHFHVSESHRGTPGAGLVDWKTNFTTLKQMDYQGWIVIEAFATDVPDIPTAINIWRNCFNSKKEVYTQGFELISSHIS